MRAARAGQPEALAALLTAGADTNLKGDRDRTALHEAIYGKANEPCIRMLIDAGAEVNAVHDRRSTPLDLAAFLGKTEIVRILIESGADVDAGEYTSPIRGAVVQKHTEIVRILLEAGADVTDPNLRLVDTAISDRDAEMLELLLAHGAPCASGEWSLPALHRAVNGRSTAVVRVLIAAGVDPAVKDRNGETALDGAWRLRDHYDGYDEIIEILTRAVEEWNRSHGGEADR